MISPILRTSKIPDLNKYDARTLENAGFTHVQSGKLCLSYLLAVISEKMFASYVFPAKNQKLLRMNRTKFTKEAVAILSLIPGKETANANLQTSHRV